MSAIQVSCNNEFFLDASIHLAHFIWLRVYESSRVHLIEHLQDTFLETYIDFNLDEKIRLNSKTLKIGTDFYQILNKTRSSLLYISKKIYILPLDRYDEYVMIILNSFIQNNFEEIMNSCTTLFCEIRGLDPMINLIIEFVEQSLKISCQLSTINSLANGFVSGAEYFVSSITWGTSKTEKLIKNFGNYIKENNPNTTQTRQETYIEPNVIEALRKVRKASETASNVTGAFASFVGAGIYHVGQALASYVVNDGANLVSNLTGSSLENSKSAIDDVLTLASASSESFYTVYDGLFNSVSSLVKTIASETVEIVDKKYGNKVATLTNEAFLTAVNATNVILNTRKLRPKALVKKTLKNAVISSQLRSR